MAWPSLQPSFTFTVPCTQLLCSSVQLQHNIFNKTTLLNNRIAQNPFTKERGTGIMATVTANEMRYESTETLLRTAAGVVSEITAASPILNKDQESRYPKFSQDEVVVGKVIGRGGFCVVNNVDKIRLNGGGSSVASTGSFGGSCLPWLCGGSSSNPAVEDHSQKGAPEKFLKGLHQDERLTREYVASHAKKRTRKGSRYVLKRVSTDASKITYMKGCVDIAMEGKFLATLDHPNIIKLVAVSKMKPCTQGYFLILEKMNSTLSQKIKAWMDMDRQNKSVIGAIAGGKAKEAKLYCEQIGASYDIVNALHYMHSKNIIFRDLKPDNIGFDGEFGTLKLFDFGLAKELREADRREDGLYRNMTNCTGAVRYMAPEVGLGQPYNLAADVYSWSMLMWFMLALEPPFGLYSNEMIFSRVMKKGSRPAVFKKWNARIADTLKCSWDVDISQRPSFLEISLTLKQELVNCEANCIASGGGKYNTDTTTTGGSSCHGSTTTSHHAHVDEEGNGSSGSS